MAFQPAPGICLVKLEYIQGGEYACNNFHVKTGAAWGSEELENITQLFYNWWVNEVAPTVSSDVSLTGIYARDLTEEFDDEHHSAESFPVPGEVENPVLPFNSTVAVKWSSNLTGRSTRGRTYHVGLSESSASGGFLTSGAQIALTAAYTALLEAIAADSEPWQLAVLSRVQDGVPLPEAIGYEVLTATINQALDSQRRRLPERGM